MADFDFNRIVERRGSGCYKWDADLPQGVHLSAEQRRRLIPLWVADMDFPAAPCIQVAIRRRAEHGIFGYVKVGDSFYTAISRWFSARHSVRFEREWMLYTTGVVPAISAVIKALAEPGQGVIIQTPVYNCFFSSVRNSGCTLVESPLKRVNLPDGRFSYEMDYDDLEARCANPNNRILLLCNPHNPAGRLWTAEELRRAGEIALRHNVIVVSDEIHCEIVAPGTAYVPFASLGEDFLHGSVTLVSPSKSFNFAGLKIAAIISDRPEWREKIDKVINIYEICDVNPFGPVALEAAYSPQGEAWLDGMNAVVWHNYDLLLQAFRRQLPECPVAELQATYLVWIDVSAIGMDSERMEASLIEHEQVWINAGSMYGSDGFIRVNLACPTALFVEGLDRLTSGLKRLLSK